MSDSKVELLKTKYLHNIPLNQQEIKFIREYSNDERNVIVNALKITYSVKSKAMAK